ncbi:MAG: 23S rRNA (uracil(1939)-C(5))-methyltransferase RlmD [Sphingobacteriia bacterium]|nr:23S rRNA (uracil(1939)-C(5))-methyltransferase RlmD [Sphingobacteriia bacterium]
MSRSRKDLPLIEQLTVIDAGAEGNAVARYDNRVVFIPYAAPGDVVDVQVFRKRSSYMEARIVNIHKPSEYRIEPKCTHFGLCGGCRWQHMSYKTQLTFKQKQVADAFSRIGHLQFPVIRPILGSSNEFYYRNKLEFTFSNRRWMVESEGEIDRSSRNLNGLGFHLPGMHDRILSIDHCYLQPDPSNKIRNWFNAYAKEQGYTYWNVKDWSGLLRNVVIRTANTGDIMVIVIFGEENHESIHNIMTALTEQFPEITSAMTIINTKKNDVYNDLPASLFKGKPFIIEQMETLKYQVGPVSFYQTNSDQAYVLYKIARDFAGLTGVENVYDLYTGTGTIANFVAKDAKKVTGIEYVESAVDDAKLNSRLNAIENTDFVAGDMAKVFNDEFVAKYGKPDVIITDPPRAGMHASVVEKILDLGPDKIVYVSCNPATQARDLALMNEKYTIEAVQPVDMFPHTHHVENVVLLLKRP